MAVVVHMDPSRQDSVRVVRSRGTYQITGSHFAIDPAPPGTPTTGISTIADRPHPIAVILAFAAVLAAWLISAGILVDGAWDEITGSTKSVVSGLTIFAVFFVAAQGIERLLEPISDLLVPHRLQQDTEHTKTSAADKQAGAAKENRELQRLRNSPTESGPTDADEKRAKDATAEAQAELDALANLEARQVRFALDQKTAFWAIATVIGIVASAKLDLYLLTAVGVATPPRALDILATGLIIGGGTKPLHDLVTLISAKSEAAKGGGTA